MPTHIYSVEPDVEVGAGRWRIIYSLAGVFKRQVCAGSDLAALQRIAEWLNQAPEYRTATQLGWPQEPLGVDRARERDE